MSFVWQGALQSAQVHILVRFGWELISVVKWKNWYKAKYVFLIDSGGINSTLRLLYGEIVEHYILVSLFVSR